MHETVVTYAESVGQPHSSLHLKACGLLCFCVDLSNWFQIVSRLLAVLKSSIYGCNQTLYCGDPIHIFQRHQLCQTEIWENVHKMTRIEDNYNITHGIVQPWKTYVNDMSVSVKLFSFNKQLVKANTNYIYHL